MARTCRSSRDKYGLSALEKTPEWIVFNNALEVTTTGSVLLPSVQKMGQPFGRAKRSLERALFASPCSLPCRRLFVMIGYLLMSTQQRSLVLRFAFQSSGFCFLKTHGLVRRNGSPDG